MTIAAIGHPNQRKFSSSPAPYAAGLAYLAAVTPHIIWLVGWNFTSAHWASNLSERGRFVPGQIISYFRNHVGLLSFSPIGAAIALLPWRLQATRNDKAFPANWPTVVIIAIDHGGNRGPRRGTGREADVLVLHLKLPLASSFTAATTQNVCGIFLSIIFTLDRLLN
jgi:hypothetical protein